MNPTQQAALAKARKLQDAAAPIHQRLIARTTDYMDLKSKLGAIEIRDPGPNPPEAVRRTIERKRQKLRAGDRYLARLEAEIERLTSEVRALNAEAVAWRLFAYTDPANAEDPADYNARARQLQREGVRRGR